MGELQPNDNGNFYDRNQELLTYLREGIRNLVAENTELTTISPYVPGSSLEYPSSRPRDVDYGDHPRQVVRFEPPSEVPALPEAAIAAHTTLQYYLRERFPKYATNPAAFELATMPSVMELRAVNRIHYTGAFIMNHVVLLANHPDVPDRQPYAPDYQPSLFQSAEFHSLHYKRTGVSGDRIRMLTIKDRVVRFNYMSYNPVDGTQLLDGVLFFPDEESLKDLADTIHGIPSQDIDP